MTDWRDHYAQLGDVYETLGTIGDWYCPGNRDFYGWYQTRVGPGDWDGEGRAWALGREFEGIRQDLDRVVYSTVNYAPARWYIHAWRAFNHGENGREWDGDESPTPNYGDLRAYAPFADIDLSDAVKQDRPDGEIPREDIEAALELYLDAFADLAGDRRHVFALDSVGGAYAFVAPTATAPIGEAETLDREARALLFEDLADKVNDWLEGVKENVNEKIPAVRDTFEPDLLNNKNRLYKAPLSLHSSLDGVVTPIDTPTPAYEYTPVGDVDGSLIEDTEAWAGRFTSDHREAVGSIVETLWPDHYADAGNWRDAVASRADELKAEQEANGLTKKSKSGKFGEEVVDFKGEVPDDIESTDDIDIVNAAIESIDVKQLARDVSDEWDTDPGRTPPRFAASWHGSHDSGTSCFADRNKFVDLKEGANGGGPLKLIARHTGILRHCSDKLRGDDYWKAVEALRKRGYAIPYFEGKDGTHPDVLRLNKEPENDEDARRQALRAMRASERA